MQKDVGKAIIIIIIIILMGSMLGNGGVSKRTPRDLRKAFLKKMGLGGCSKDAKGCSKGNFLGNGKCQGTMWVLGNDGIIGRMQKHTREIIYLFIYYFPKLMDTCVNFGCTHPIDGLF